MTLVILIEIKGSFTESSVHSTVISQTRDLHLKFYPETGHLIPGVPNRVYFEALADHKGTDVAEFLSADLIIVDVNHTETVVVEDIKPTHIGRGMFEFVPKVLKSGEIYMLRAKWNRANNPQRYLIPSVDLTKNVVFKVEPSSIID